MQGLSPQLFLLVYLHSNVGPPSPPAAALLRVLSARLPVSIPPASLDECFLFNSLVVGLPYSSIFCQFWLFFVFKFVVVLLVVRGGAVCLPTPPSWLEVSGHILSVSSLRSSHTCLSSGLLCPAVWPSIDSTARQHYC